MPNIFDTLQVDLPCRSLQKCSNDDLWLLIGKGKEATYGFAYSINMCISVLTHFPPNQTLINLIQIMLKYNAESWVFFCRGVC